MPTNCPGCRSSKFGGEMTITHGADGSVIIVHKPDTSVMGCDPTIGCDATMGGHLQDLYASGQLDCSEVVQADCMYDHALVGFELADLWDRDYGNSAFGSDPIQGAMLSNTQVGQGLLDEFIPPGITSSIFGITPGQASHAAAPSHAAPSVGGGHGGHGGGHFRGGHGGIYFGPYWGVEDPCWDEVLQQWRPCLGTPLGY